MKATKVIFTLVLTMLAIGASAQKNLVKNGGFEDEVYDWDNSNIAKVTPWDFKEGKSSCVITVADISNWVGLSQIISLPKNAQGIAFGAWLKTTNVVKGKDEWMGALYSIEFLDKHEKKIGDGVNLALLIGYNDWELIKKNVKVPLGATAFKIMLAMGYASGTMQVDDVSAKVLNAEEVAKL